MAAHMIWTSTHGLDIQCGKPQDYKYCRLAGSSVHYSAADKPEVEALCSS